MNKNLIFKLVLIVLALVFACGCASSDKKPVVSPEELELIPIPQKYGLPEPSGGMTLSVGKDTLTAQEVISALVEYLGEIPSSDYKTFKTQVKPQIGAFIETKISNILLAEMASNSTNQSVEEQLDKLAEQEVRAYINDIHNGDYAKAEEELRKGGLNWASFKELKKKQILSQSYVSEQLNENKLVTHTELLVFYNANKDRLFSKQGLLEFRLIDIQPAKITLDDPNQDSSQAAQQLVDKIIAEIEQDQDFAALAKQYSHGHKAESGGLWSSSSPESIAAPYDILVTKAESMQIDEVTEPIDAAGRIFIMKLLKNQQTQHTSFEQAQQRIEEYVLAKRRLEEVNKLQEKLLARAGVIEKGGFVEFCTEQIYLQLITQ